ncbi:MAG: hypothetical protein ABIY50_04290 [Ignavibacteria bacterium]
MIRLIIFFALFIIPAGDLLSQIINIDTNLYRNKTGVYISDTTYECTIVTASRSVYKDVNLYGLNDSSVKILKKGVTKEILISDIRTVKFNARGFGKGALIGGGIGFALGFITGGQHFGFSRKFQIGDGMLLGFITAIPFLLIGGGLGSLFAEDQFYDLSNLDLQKKKDKMSFLISEFSDK